MQRYVPPHRRGTGTKIVLVDAHGLGDALRDFGLPSTTTNTHSEGLIEALILLAQTIGLNEDEIVIKSDDNLIFRSISKKKEFYFAKLNERAADTLVSEMNLFFKRLSNCVSQKRVEGMLRQESVIDATEKFRLLGDIDSNGDPPTGVGSFAFLAIVTNESRVQNDADAKNEMKKYHAKNVNTNTDIVANAVSLTLFRRPREESRPTHVLTFRSSKEPSKRELVGGGHLNMALDVSFAEGARRELYEETFGLAGALPGGIPLAPTLAWEGFASGKFYVASFAMVVVDDDEGAIEALPDILNDVAQSNRVAFQADPLSTLYPETKDHQWTPVDEFEAVCRKLMKVSWRHLHKFVEDN